MIPQQLALIVLVLGVSCPGDNRVPAEIQRLLDRGDNAALIAQYKHEGDVLIARVQPQQRTAAEHLPSGLVEPAGTATPPNKRLRPFFRRGSSRESSHS